MVVGGLLLSSKRNKVLNLVVASPRGKGCCCSCCGSGKSTFDLVGEINSGTEEKSSPRSAGESSGLAVIVDDERKRIRNEEWEEIGGKGFMMKNILKSINVTNGKGAQLYIPLVKLLYKRNSKTYDVSTVR